MSELNDSPDLQIYSSAVLYIISAVTTPLDFVDVIIENFADAIKSSAVSLTRMLGPPFHKFLESSHGASADMLYLHSSYFSTAISQPFVQAGFRA
jgi:hypothetical protein